jgi:hypothetical protein
VSYGCVGTLSPSVCKRMYEFRMCFVVDYLCRGSEEQILDFFGFLRLGGMDAVGNVAQLLRECTFYKSVSYGCVSNLAKCL